MLEALLRGSSSSQQPSSTDSASDEELMEVASVRSDGIEPAWVSSSTVELVVTLDAASGRLVGPGPCFGRHLLKMAPSHDMTKTADSRTLKDNCLYFMCIPIWARTGAAFAIGLTFLLVAFFTNRIDRLHNQITIGNYYKLDEGAGGFDFWRESTSHPNLGNFSACVSVCTRQQSLRYQSCSSPHRKLKPPPNPCVWCPTQPGGEFRVVYLYNISNSEEVRSAMGSAAEPTVQPTIQEVGPYYYAVTWNYTDLVRATSASSFEHISVAAHPVCNRTLSVTLCAWGQEWSTERELLNYTVNEDLVFCPGDVLPWEDGRLSDDEPITNVGLAFQAARYSGNTAIPFTSDDYIVTRRARDWVMGYEDEKLRDADGVRNPIVTPLQHNMSVSTQTDWAMPSNLTLQIWTGVSRSVHFAGYMSRVQNTGNAQVCRSFASSGPLCEDAWPCTEDMEDCPDVETRLSPEQAEGPQLGYINGSTGQRFPWQPDFASLASEPLNCQYNLSLWVPSLLRTVALYCDPSQARSPVVALGSEDRGESPATVYSRRFRIAPEDAMPSTERPFNAGYDMYGSPWIWNLTAQRQAPIFMSLPYFANSTFELNTTTGMTASNVVGLRAPDELSLPWLDIETHSGVRLRGAMRFQTNVLVTGNAGEWSAPWMVPIGRVNYENNASDSTIRVIYGLAYEVTIRTIATKVVTVICFFVATLFLTLSVQIGVKYYQMQRGLLKKKKRLSRSCAMASFVRRACLRCGLCGPDRGDIVRRLQEMKQEELLSPLLVAGQNVTPLTSIQETAVNVTSIQEAVVNGRRPPTARRQAATENHGIEAHFGKLEQMSSDESDEDRDAQNDNAHVVTQFDLEMWDDLVAPPGRSKLHRCSMILELMPWLCWWAVGIVPKWTLTGRFAVQNWGALETRALVLSAILSGLVVSSQMLQRLCTAKKDRVFVLVPTIVDISTLVVFSVSAVIAGLGAQKEASWQPWPAITHGSVLVIALLCMACGHPFILPVYCRELRPEIWRERIVFRVSEVVSWVWCIILLLITILQTIPVFTTSMPSSERGFLYGWIPIMLLAITFWFTIWYSMQVEEEFVRALNRLLRKAELRSRRDDTARVDISPTPGSTHTLYQQHPSDIQQRPADGSSADDEVDVRIVPTSSPRNALNGHEAGMLSSRVVSPGISGRRRPDVFSTTRIPKLMLEGSVEVSESAEDPAPEVYGTPSTMQPADLKAQVQPRSLRAEVERTIETDARSSDVVAGFDSDEHVAAERYHGDKMEETNKEIQKSVSALQHLEHSCHALV